MPTRSSTFRTIRRKRVAEHCKHYGIRAGVIVIVIIIAIALAAWGSGYEKITVRSISVAGNEITENERIKEIARLAMEGRYFYLFDKSNILIFPRAHIVENLAGVFPRLSNIEIERQSLAALAISVSEREPAYLICMPAQADETKGSQCFFADKDGFIFARAPHFSGDVYTRVTSEAATTSANILGTHAAEEKKWSHITALEALLVERGKNVKQIRVRERDEYELILENGVRLLFNTSESPERLADNFDSVLQEVPLEQNIDYIDFRFGNKVFYREHE